jgi:hypothetical protein
MSQPLDWLMDALNRSEWNAVFHISKILYLEEVKVSVYKQKNVYTNLTYERQMGALL